ncbi:LysR substrate-binding domain-containing protein [Brucella intermedia]|uniref:LysR substrate-binding domain-containing protein n=1 Tax=Brucella intermedia TaxID=94625 RepID=UPI0022490C95|nr:LysR substrate-binding domain-containing protein [Brucella intermedia]
MLRYSHVEAFRAVMLTGSTTAAAQMLNSSQPNISRSIAQLEKLSGLTLFERLPGKLVPTNDGRSFFKEVQRSFRGLRQLDDAAKRIRRFTGGSLTIAAIQTLALGLIPRTIKRFVQQYPDASIAVHTGHSSAVSQWVDDQTCDIGVVALLNDTYGLEHEVLYEVDAVCALPKGHHLATKAVIEPRDLENELQISLPRNEFGSSVVDGVFDEAGISREIKLETSHSAIACALVAQGLGVAVVNPFAALDYRQTEITVRPFLPAIKHSGYLLYPRGKPDNRLISSFVSTLKLTASDDRESMILRLQDRI